MDNWIDGLSRNLGEAPLASAETTQLLSAAGDVAHRIERKMTRCRRSWSAAPSGAGLRTEGIALKQSATRGLSGSGV
jgi:hypothetical protein